MQFSMLSAHLNPYKKGTLLSMDNEWNNVKRLKEMNSTNTYIFEPLKASELEKLSRLFQRHNLLILICNIRW